MPGGETFRPDNSARTGQPTGGSNPGRLTVSVVIPVKDDDAALGRCLAALARQRRHPDEIVVVDNGSSDRTAAVARSWGARVVEQPDPGIPSAAATGYDAARFDVIARLDADSITSPFWIENGLRRLEADAALHAVTGPGTFYDGPVRGSRMIGALYLGAYFGSVRLALATTPLFGSTFFMRRSAWLRVRTAVHTSGLGLHDDLDLTIHLTPEHRIAFDDAVRVGISYRPFTETGTFGLRLQRGVRTFTSNWPRSSPTLRWRRVMLDSGAAAVLSSRRAARALLRRPAQ